MGSAKHLEYCQDKREIYVRCKVSILVAAKTKRF